MAVYHSTKSDEPFVACGSVCPLVPGPQACTHNSAGEAVAHSAGQSPNPVAWGLEDWR